MPNDSLEQLRQQIDQLFIDNTVKHKTILQILHDAVRQIRQITGRGGSYRVIGERAIIDLIKEFDTTRQDKAPWPLSQYMMGHQENAEEAAILQQFQNDLRHMSLEEMKEELDRVTSQIDEDTPWQEALSVAIRRQET